MVISPSVQVIDGVEQGDGQFRSRCDFVLVVDEVVEVVEVDRNDVPNRDV
jgi:hypothetical protein